MVSLDQVVKEKRLELHNQASQVTAVDKDTQAGHENMTESNKVDETEDAQYETNLP